MNQIKNVGTDELMRMYLYNISLLQGTNQNLREILWKFEYNDPIKEDLDQMNQKWHVGMEALKEISKIKEEFSQKTLEINTQKQVRILNDNIKLQIKDFENYLKQIKENNSLAS